MIILEIVSLILSSTWVLPILLFLETVKGLTRYDGYDSKRSTVDIHMPELNTNDELADLADIFNEMLDRMRLYIEQQEQFVEDVSHELRTPVAIIEGHLSLLNRWGKDDPEILNESLSCKYARNQSNEELVQEMLDLSRAEQVDVHYANETTLCKRSATKCSITLKYFIRIMLLH